MEQFACDGHEGQEFGFVASLENLIEGLEMRSQRTPTRAGM